MGNPSKPIEVNPLTAQQEFTDQRFRKVTLGKVTVRGIAYFGCRFAYCALREVTFQACRFVDCTFQDCDLTVFRVPETQFQDTSFQRCRLLGVDWTLAAWSQYLKEAPISFNACTLDYSSFFGLRLAKIKFEDCRSHEVDFSEADLNHAVFTGTDLTGSHFHHTNLSRADFAGATNYDINLSNNNVKQARFAMPEALALLYGLDIVLVE